MEFDVCVSWNTDLPMFSSV